MTAYQLGTHAFYALRAKQDGDTTQLLLLGTIDIHEDPLEAWLSDYPPHQIVPEVEAMKSLVEFQTWHLDRTERQLLQAHKTWRAEQETLKAQYNDATADSERRYLAEVHVVLRRPPDASDLLELAQRFDKLRYAEDAEASHRLEGESEGEARIRRAVENGTKALKQLEENYRQARESLGIFRTPEQEVFHRQTTRVPTREELSAAKRIDEEFQRYRALIQRHERKPHR